MMGLVMLAFLAAAPVHVEFMCLLDTVDTHRPRFCERRTGLDGGHAPAGVALMVELKTRPAGA
jgi:hypothetical protein